MAEEKNSQRDSEVEKEADQATSPTPQVNSSIIDPKIGGLLAYLLGFISGLVLYLISQDKYIRFHAMQSIIFSLGCSVLFMIIGYIPVIGMLTPILWLGWAVVWIILMIKTYQGEKYKLPVIGDFAEQKS